MKKSFSDLEEIDFNDDTILQDKKRFFYEENVVGIHMDCGDSDCGPSDCGPFDCGSDPW